VALQRYFKIDADDLGYIINAYWIELYLNSYFYFHPFYHQ